MADWLDELARAQVPTWRTARAEVTRASKALRSQLPGNDLEAAVHVASSRFAWPIWSTCAGLGSSPATAAAGHRATMTLMRAKS
jgi:hypothetical protein